MRFVLLNIFVNSLHSSIVDYHIGLESRNKIKSFIAKRVNSILINLRYLRFKLLKYKENNIYFLILLIIHVTPKIFLYI